MARADVLGVYKDIRARRDADCDRYLVIFSMTEEFLWRSKWPLNSNV